MADTSTRIDPVQGDDPPGTAPRKPVRRRRGLRVALVSLGSLVVLLGAVAAGGYAYVNHLAGSVHRIPVKFTSMDAASEPVGAMNVLITGAGTGSVGSAPAGSSGLIMLLHINAGGKAGGVVSFSPQTMVQVPGEGRTQIINALAEGGPSLLVQTVQQLTHVRINHYARIDFTHVANVVNAVGGVNVTLPAAATSEGYTFNAGVNHLSGTTAGYYVRQPSLTEQGRVLRQESLIRAVMSQLASAHLLTNPVTAVRVTHALISMLTVDSNFTNSQLEKLVTELGALSSSAGTFVTAPTQTANGSVSFDQSVSTKLWQAIQKGSMAAFAKSHPATVTPTAVP